MANTIITTIIGTSVNNTRAVTINKITFGIRISISGNKTTTISIRCSNFGSRNFNEIIKSTIGISIRNTIPSITSVSRSFITSITITSCETRGTGGTQIDTTLTDVTCYGRSTMSLISIMNHKLETITFVVD
jgi:hypothetical protein